MTPETRAARDRISAFLDAWTENVGTLDDAALLSAQTAPRQWTALTIGDLRVVLAALDQQPSGLVTAPPHVTDK